MNVVAIRADEVPEAIATKYMLVPDAHDRAPLWWKAVVMDHVDSAMLERFTGDLGRARGG